MNMIMQNKRIYLDWAAATPLSPEVFSVMEPWLRTNFGNPSSIHQEGLQNRLAINDARDKVAKVLQVKPEFVTFTSGGTESNNLVLFGLVEEKLANGFRYDDLEIITTKIEHPSIAEVVAKISMLGVKVKYVTVDETGRIDLVNFKSLLSAKTILVACAYANSEIGVVQPLHSIKKIIREIEAELGTTILFQVDAAQAPLWLSCHFDTVGADFLVLDVGKCNGPKGLGMLIQSRRAKLKTVLFGGGQEQGLRSGTENVAGIVGGAEALFLAQSNYKTVSETVSLIRDAGIKYLLETIPNVILNGSTGENRLANNINFSVPGLDTEYAVVVLDSRGFATSTKSACAGAGGGESKVVKAISDDPARANSTIRFSLGPATELEEVKAAIDVLMEHIQLMSTLNK
jgi:cysteine desulfurase